MLTVELGGTPAAVARVRHDCTPWAPDAWKVTLVPPAPAAVPAPGAEVVLSGPGADGTVRLLVLQAATDAPSGRVVLTCTRMFAAGLAQPAVRAAQGLLPAVFDLFRPNVVLTTAARNAIKGVRVCHLPPPAWPTGGGALTRGGLVRRLVRWVVAERGVPLRLRPGPDGCLVVSHPLHDAAAAAAGTRRRTAAGHPDPLGGRRSQARVADAWKTPDPDGLAAWLPAADLTATDDGRVVTRFRARWAHPDLKPGAATRFLRESVSVGEWVGAARAAHRGSGWTALAKFGPKAAIDGLEGLFHTVSPLGWVSGKSGPVPVGKVVARVAVPYAGSSAAGCGWHTLPEPDSLVWVASPSAFETPVVLGNAREKDVSRDDFGLYLPPGRLWRHQSKELYVTANSKFDPPEG